MLWTGIRSIVIVKIETLFLNISHLLGNGTHVNDPVKMANLFDKYFVNVGSNIDKTIPRTKKSPADYLKDRISQSMFLAPVCPEEIQTIIHSLNADKAIEPYSIPVFLLKILSGIISLPLSSIINHSFETGVFPDKMKIGKVTPLHKKDSTDNPSNYRPISILSVFSKIFERLVYKCLYQFLDAFEVLYSL